MSDALAALVRVNLALAAAVALILVLRRPMRRLVGARLAYGLWAVAPLAAGAMVLPPRVMRVHVIDAPLAAQPSVSSDLPLAASALHATDFGPLLTALWIAGAVVSLWLVAWRQGQFARAVRDGRAGPAVVGVLRPRIVTPRDFTRRYSEREQLVVLAHERTHILRQDPRINALVALARCLNWFNPLVHMAAHSLRIDQELACDAQVVAAHPSARRSYAEAMLKTQLAARPLPLGCYWPAATAHPLAERIALLANRTPSLAHRRIGAAGLVLIVLSSGWAAWAARPVEVHFDLQAYPPPAALDAPPATAPTITAAPSHRKPVQAVPGTLAPEARLAEALAAPVPTPADSGQVGPTDKLLPPEAEPPLASRRFHAAAHWSSVEPGSAVRVLASMTDSDGLPLVTDLTAFGSQSLYRVGYVSRNASRYKLFTSVTQRGDRLEVTAAVTQPRAAMIKGAVSLASGETGMVALPGGLNVRVTPTLRPETPEEVQAANRLGGRTFVRVDRVETP